jgi:histidyl-tRNA synthetase
VFVAVATEDALGYAVELAETLRSAGIAADLGLTAKLAAQFKHADRLGCPFVVTVGTSERESGTYSLKSMREGEETRGLPAAGLVDELKRRGI